MTEQYWRALIRTNELLAHAKETTLKPAAEDLDESECNSLLHTILNLGA